MVKSKAMGESDTDGYESALDSSKGRRENILFCLCVFLFLHVRMCVRAPACVCFVIDSHLSLWKTKQEISLDFVSFTIQATLGKKSCLCVSTSTGSFPNPQEQNGDWCNGQANPGQSTNIP